MNHEDLNTLVTLALTEDSDALEKIIIEIQDFVFNISLRMLGNITDAEDASQDILIRIMTNLASFQGKSSFKTWVYSISCNYLIDYKKSLFSKQALDFDFYSNDIKLGFVDAPEALLMGVSKEDLANELKLSCTNVMLQCLDSQSRCIFILGTMFKVDSKVAGEVLNITPENYRQKLSRARKKVASFLSTHCGLTETGFCCCEKRVNYAIQQHRINPKQLDYTGLNVLDRNILEEYKDMMESIDDLTLVFDELPHYKSNIEIKAFLKHLMQTKDIEKIQHYEWRHI